MIWLARHGETTWNVEGRYQGRLESPLSELGMRQAAALALHFSAVLARSETVPARVVSSPLGRCVETARPSAEALGVPLETDARLIEIAHGTWEGRYRDELAANDPERYRTWRTDPAHVSFDGGETVRDVLERWRSFAAELALRDEPALVVTHDAVVRCALVDLEDRSLDDFWNVRVENGAYALLARRAGRFEIVEQCVHAHLAGLRAPIGGQAL